MLKLIVAHCKNGGIGINNKLPWRLKTDLKRFQKLTVGNKNNAVIMGKNTWHSLNGVPLKNRKNIVLSTTLSDQNNGILVKKSLQDAVNYCNKNAIENVWIMGGEQLYKNALDTVDIDELFITEISENIICDTFFPDIPLKYVVKDKSEWENENGISYRYVTYKNNSLDSATKSLHFTNYKLAPDFIIGV